MILEYHIVSIKSKILDSQGDYLDLAARVKALEHKVEPKWTYVTTFIIGLLVIMLAPILYISINEQYITEDNNAEHILADVPTPTDTSEISEPVDENEMAIQSIAEGILTEWNVNIWSDLQKLFN